MQIKKLSIEEVLPLRSLVLRENRGIEFSGFAEDQLTETFHLGLVEEGEIVCIASFMPCAHQMFSNTGWQLRGMATHPGHRGKGLGAAILTHSKSFLLEAKADYLWCNARLSAVGFYQKCGFRVISEEFLIENIGPHFQMVLELK